MDARPLVLALLLALLLAVPATAHDAGVTHRDTIQEVNFDFAGAVEGGGTAIASGYGDAGLSYLPLRWCGTPRSSDDTANQVHDASLPQVKFVYAYASDQENRTAQWADLLQANASLISRFYAQQSGGQRAPRFDMGTECGRDYIDLATVALPSARSAYLDDFDTVEAAVDAQLPRTSAQPRIYLILADKLSAKTYLWGQGSYFGDDAKGTANANNNGGVTSVIWIRESQTLPTTSTAQDEGFWPEGFLHEMTHNFGGVQDGAPNTTLAGHCRDGRDVMCYSDGGPLAYDPNVCPFVTSFTSGLAQTLDCGRDDYFSPAPAAGSWLDTHFNTFDNVFNGDCPALGNQCGGGVAPATANGPKIAGTTRDGQTLAATTGTWSGSPALSFQWEEEASGTWQPYAHDSLTLTLGPASVGRRYRLKVTATGAETVVARSQPTVPVVAKLTPYATARPSISGSARNGDTLTSTQGEWGNATSYAYQWYRAETATSGMETINGATTLSYTATLDDLDYYLRLRVTATSADGITATSTSTPYGPVVTAPVNVSAPTVSGTAKVGRTLTSSAGTWHYASSTPAREWQREVDGTWSSISGATGSSYTLTADDAGRRIRLLVTASNENGSTSAASAPTSAVATLLPPVNTAAPVATGTAQQGQTLTAGGDAWTGASSTSARWERRVSGGDWTAISGATSRSYVLAAADVDAEVRAVVTATNSDGSTAVASAARGPVVTNVPPANTDAPVVTGVARTGQTLTASTGTWLRATEYAYAWQRLSGGTWSPIAGATAATYVPASADAGLPLRAVVTATGWGGSTSAASAQTSPVGEPPVLQSPPTISGVAGIHRTLTASAGTWSNALTYQYQWQRLDGDAWGDIPGATGATYGLDVDDVGHAIRVRVTAANSSGAGEPAVSAATAAVGDADPPDNIAPPVVTGTLYEGETLTAGGDEWRAAESLSVQWQRRAAQGDWFDIGGATGRTYVLTADDLEADVRVVVTASNHYGDIPEPSQPRGPVDGDPMSWEPPVVSGTLRLGETLSATPGVWLRAVTYAYQWERQEDRLPEGSVWTPIPGASESTYQATEADAGLELRVVVTASGSRAAASAASEQTPAVISPPIMRTPPAVDGAPKRGRSSVASPGQWAAAGNFAYRWERQAGASWEPITGATSSAYAPVEADLGRSLRVRVTAIGVHGETEGVSAATAPVVDLQPPVNVSPPVVSGTLYHRLVLNVSDDAWTGADSTTMEWQRRTGGGGWTSIGNERDHVLTTADIGADIRVLVTAVNQDGETVVASAPRGPVDGDPVATAAPVVSGTPRVGSTLTATSGIWLRASTFAYAWQRRDGEEAWSYIPGANQPTYTAVAEDAGHSLRAVVIATGSRMSIDAVSAWTAPVESVDPPESLAAPAVQGALYAGETVTAAGDEWTGATATAVVWQRRAGAAEWTAIPGAAARTYTLTAADAGHDVRVLVTALNDAGDTVAASAARGPIDADPLNTAPPQISGTARAGTPLSASAGTWLRATSHAYAWQRLAGGVWSDIPAATGATYTPAVADVGLPLRVLVAGTGSRATVAAASAQTQPVLAAPAPDPTTPTPTPTQEPATPGPPDGAEEGTGAAPRSVGFAVALRAGRKAAGKVVVTVTGGTASVAGKKLKLRAGRYTARLCAGSKCVSRKVKVAGGRLTVSGLAIPAPAGQITVTLKPARGKTAAGRFVLAAR